MKTLSLNTLAALNNATEQGIVIRDFVTISAKNRDTGDTETIGFWNGNVPVTANVIDPATGDSDSRSFQAGGAIVSIPSLPSGMETEVRTIRLKFSKLPEAVLNVVRTYNPKMAPIQIFRGFFDPATMSLVDPAVCRFDGYINRAPIKTPKAGGEGSIELECVSHARELTRTSGKLFSYQTIVQRSSDKFGKYLDVAGAWRVWWGSEEIPMHHNPKKPKRERFFG